MVNIKIKEFLWKSTEMLLGVCFVSGSAFATSLSWVSMDFSIIFLLYLNLIVSGGQSNYSGWGTDDKFNFCFYMVLSFTS